MSTTPDKSPFETNPLSNRRLCQSVLVAIVLSGIVLVTIVLPAEYSIDPTGIGSLLGLKKTTGAPGKKIVLVDTLGGNEKIAPTDTSGSQGTPQPIPLPNPAVHQSQTGPAVTDTLKLTLPPFGQTEVKAVLQSGKMMLYSWKTENGKIYVDFHGHNSDWEDKEAFVRYEAKNESTGANGSLVAPFNGEHGWYWLNSNNFPVTITLVVQGYQDKIINYGIK